MAVIKRLLTSHDGRDQILKLDSNKRYIVNTSPEWQMLLGSLSELTNSRQVLKIAAEFNVASFEGIRLVAYLFNPSTGGVDSSASCTFDVYVVRSPNWQDIFVASFVGADTSNSYYFSDVPSSSIPSINLFGGDTVMVEAVITRLNQTYRDRVYINHLGIYDNAFRMRQDIEFLDLTKLDE